MIKSLSGRVTKDIANKGSSKKFPERLNKRAIFMLMVLSDVSEIEIKHRHSAAEFWVTMQAKWELQIARDQAA